MNPFAFKIVSKELSRDAIAGCIDELEYMDVYILESIMVGRLVVSADWIVKF